MILLSEIGDDLQPIGTLMYEEAIDSGTSTNWQPHRNIWRVTAHRECQDFPNAPVVVRNAIELVRQEDT